MPSVLFSEYNLNGLSLRNRIVMPPMSLFIAKDGQASDFHLVHYTARAIGGVGLIIQEATGVEACGRITDDCLGLYEDSGLDMLKRILFNVKEAGAAMGIQLNHAGRKSKTTGPYIYAPSGITFDEGYRQPQEATLADIDRIVNAFGEAAGRAKKVGYDLVEIHAAHGYLLSSFLSPLSNKRTDEYGGSYENRTRLLIRVLDAVKQAFGGMVTIRVSADDFTDGGIVVEDMVKILNLIRSKVELVHVSSGGVKPGLTDTFGGFQVHLGENTLFPVITPSFTEYHIKLAEHIRRECGLPVIAGGFLEDPNHLEEIVASGRADLVYIGRALLRNPHLPLEAAHVLRAQIEWPSAYMRAKNERIN